MILEGEAEHIYEDIPITGDQTQVRLRASNSSFKYGHDGLPV